MTQIKKLIEVALPLDAINDASLFDKSPLVGTHPKDIHPYPARLPLPAARAILFASLIDDPSVHLEKFPTLKSQGNADADADDEPLGRIQCIDIPEAPCRHFHSWPNE